ncbi:MAG: CYTH and CHAD domain-containing protein [Dermatophilaceae bacterium]|nr:CYTH and CHAD domain-containing protein [Dermatophilaceae bacterium]
MAATHHQETERKFDVDAHIVFPNLATVEGVVSVDQPTSFELAAVYFDTPRLLLSRHGITLRRRTGGTDEGWHLKLPRQAETRTEVREPLGGDPEAVPDDLRARVRELVLDEPLQPVATVETTRREYALRDSDGIVAARVSDDAVRARRLRDGRARDWREWEVELDAAPEAMLDVVGEALLAAGASRASSRSKLSRTLGKRHIAEQDQLAHPRHPEGTTARLLSDHLATQAAQLHEHTDGVRAGHAESVHRLRIAARRLRSSFSTFRPVLDRAVTDPVHADLRWLGAELAPARDAQVLREHLLRLLSSEQTDLVLGPVAGHIDDELRAAARDGVEKARAALDSDRYARLAVAIDGFVSKPPLLADADSKATDVLPRLLARDLKRLDRAVGALSGTTAGPERDRAFHEARKKAKRLRYAAETATPALGKQARSLAKSSKRAQKVLGEHQDSVNARRRLRELAVQVHLAAGNSFTYGRLHALEQARADQAEEDFAAVWKRLRRKHLHG